MSGRFDFNIFAMVYALCLNTHLLEYICFHTPGGYWSELREHRGWRDRL